MNSYVSYNFVIEKEFEVNEQKFKRIYQYSWLPGSPWEEIEGALDELKSKMSELRLQAEEQEKLKNEKPTDEVVEAEVL